jgi:hypothetical protein
MYETISTTTEEQTIRALSSEAAEAYLNNLLKKISNTALAQQKEDELWEKIHGDELSIQEACLEISSFIQKRETAINKTGFIENNSLETRTIQERDFYIHSIRLSQLSPNCFLGNGAVAEVYSIINENQNLCVKIVTNYTKHAEENTLYQEARFLEKLVDFTKEGVRTPELKDKMSLINLNALVMEELDAVNMARVIEGQDTLPENFNADDYFRRLAIYINALHSEQGIYHLDIAARNLMIDKETGFPYVIDFGKSKFKDDFMGEKSGDFESIYEGKDAAGMAAARSEIKRWIDQGKQPLTKLRF